MAQMLYSLMLAIVLISSPEFVHLKTLDSDARALQSLKHSIDPNTISKSCFLHSWDFNVDPCESSGSHFLGIICEIPSDNSGSRVTQINLDGIGYEGFLTPDIGNLTELVILDLSKNKFRGPIPETISRLRKLTKLSLQENFFTGEIPHGISVLKKMDSLDLAQNRLSGSIPLVLSGLRSLTLLRLSNNGFSGRIPELSGLWKLVDLNISSNQLFGSIPNIPTRLHSLSLSHNFLTGHTYSIGRLHQLQTLDLSDNRLSGVIKSNLLTLPRLRHVNVSLNRFTSIKVVDFTHRESQLEELDAHNNNLQGYLPTRLATMPNLRSINLGHNQFNGQIPAVYGEKMKSWRSLFLDYNFLVGNLPPTFRSSVLKIQGSFANNCLLACPEKLHLCHGMQRPASDCGRKTESLKPERDISQPILH